jgi:signal transduction histidine kinase
MKEYLKGKTERNMELKDRRALEKELNELKKSYRDILNSNIKLSDELRWTKEDKERLTRRIERAIEMIEDKKIIEILKNDFWEDDE